jgi:hypothetical protein
MENAIDTLIGLGNDSRYTGSMLYGQRSIQSIVMLWGSVSGEEVGKGIDQIFA